MTTLHKLPTGYLIVNDYSKGKLETLSIGDYGKAVNVKADFLGFTAPINGVPDAVVLFDNFGQTTILFFSGFQKNPSVPASTFVFTPPAGTRTSK